MFDTSPALSRASEEIDAADRTSVVDVTKANTSVRVLSAMWSLRDAGTQTHSEQLDSACGGKYGKHGKHGKTLAHGVAPMSAQCNKTSTKIRCLNVL